MAMYAELFDGTRLEFPDGTDPSVIQGTAKRLTLERQTPAEKPAPVEQPVDSSPILGSIEKGIVGAKQSVKQAQIASLMDLQAADKEKYGETYQGAPSDQLDAISARDKTIQDKLREVAEYGIERKNIDTKRGVNPLSQEVSAIRNTEAYKNADTLDQLKMYGNALWDKKADIPGYIAGVSLESLPSSLPTIAAAMAARFGGMGPTGAAIAGGAGSSFTEFGNQYAELRADGLDHKEAWEKAGVKSGVIGLFDAASFKSAGGAASNIMRNIEKGAIKQTAKETGKEIGTQALYGMAGEGLGSVSINQKVDPISVIEEGIGEIAGAPVEAVTTYRKNVAETKAAPPKSTTETTETTAPELTPGTPIPTEQQGNLFAPEALPASTATLTPDTLAAQTQAGKPVETEALQAPERAQAEIERNIFALQQQEQTPQVKEQIAALQEQLVKGPGENLDVLKQEHTVLANKGTAIQTQIQELTVQRDATPTMDAKLAITEQIKPLQAQLETIIGRQQELIKEGAVLAKQVAPTETTETAETAPTLDLEGTITEDDFKTMKINKSNQKLRTAILGKKLSDPAQRQEVIDILNDYASSPNRSAAMSTRISDFINSISQEAQNDERTGAGAVNGPTDGGVQLPSVGVQATEGTTTPEATGVGSVVGATTRPDGGEGVSGENGNVALNEPAATTTTPPTQTTTAQATPAQGTSAAQEAANNSAGFNAGNKAPPKTTFFRNIATKFKAMREGNLNVGTLAFGNLQNFAANNQAFINLMRSKGLDRVKAGLSTMEEAKNVMLGLIGAQVSQRGTLAVQMDNGNWTYDAPTNTYTAVPDADNMSVFGDLVKQLATRLGISPEIAHEYMDNAIEANRLQDVLNKRDSTKGDITRTQKRIEFLKGDIKRQKAPKGTKTAAEQKAFDRAETARVKKVQEELKLKEALLIKLQKNFNLYTDQAMHKDRPNITEGMKLFNNNPEIQEGVRVWNVMRQRTIDFMVSQGLLTEDKAQQWMDEAAYVPFFREMESTTEEAQHVITKGLRETMAPLRAKYKGSMLDVASVTGNMRSWMQWALAGAISNGQINRMLDTYRAWIPDEVKEGKGNTDNTFTVMQGGVERRYHVAEPAIANAFMQQAAYVLPLMQIAKTVSNITRHSVTRNPAFSLVQIPMDLYAAMFTSGIKNPGELVIQLFKEATLTAVDKSKTRKGLISKGLLNTHDYNAMTAEDAIKYAQDIVPPSYYRQAMNALDKFGAFSDNVVRQAVRNQLVNEGHSEQAADTAAVEIINFRNKSGVKGLNTLSGIVMFFNSWLQQAAIVLKTLSGKGITFQTRKEGLATLATVFGKIATFSFILAVINGASEDEDEYAKRSRTAKNRIFGIPGTGGMGMPIREDLWALPKVLGDYAAREMLKEFKAVKDSGVDRKALVTSLGNMFKNTFAPPGEGIPQLVKPTAEAMLGVDIHTGRQIVPEHMKNLEPYLQFNATTSEFAKWLGEKANVSPLHLDHLLKGYFGTTAQLMDMATGSIIANVRDIPKPTESTRVTLGKLPSIGMAFGKEGNQAVAGDFYEVKKDFDRSMESYKKIAQANPEAAETYRKEHEDTMFKASNITKRLEVLKRQENVIRNLPSKEKNPTIGMTADEKAAKLKQIDDIRSGFAPVVKAFREKAYK
jgi:hypothetical protein